MTTLTQFLTEIGANALPSTVQAPKDDATSAPLAQLFARLEDEITAINDQTRELLEQNWSSFQEQVADGKELLVRMDEEGVELSELENELESNRIPTLIDRLTAHSSLAQTYSLSTHTLALLTTLLGFHTAISIVSNHITAGALPLAVAAVRDLQGAITRGAESWIEETDAWKSLRKWAADEQIRLEGAVLGTLEACFDFTPASGTTGATLKLRSSIAAAPKGEQLAVPVLLQALEDVFVLGGAGKKVDGLLARVAKHLLKYFIVPFLEANGQPSSLSQVEIVYTEDMGAAVATLQPRTAEPPGQGEGPLDSIAKLLTFFASHTTLLPPSPYAASFTANLTPVVQQLVISAHLQPSLPATIDRLGPYLPLLSAAESFEAGFLVSNGYFAFLPKDSRGQMREEGKVIRSWVSKVDKQWAKKFGDRALSRVRDEIRQFDWEADKMTVEVEVEGDEPGTTHTVTEFMLISKRVKTIVATAEELLNESMAVASATFEYPNFASAAPLLLGTFTSVLSLYRAAAPVHHATTLVTAPAIGMQFAQDIDWISKKVGEIWQRSKDEVKRGEAGHLVPEVERGLSLTKKMGAEWRAKQINTRRQALSENLDDAQGFLYTSDDARFARCERAVSDISDNLTTLSRAWKPVMNPTTFYTTLGTLVNEVLQRILDEIMDQLDISEEESIRLNKLCKALHDLENLFESEVTSIGSEVPVWFKFVFLSELLEASMADILFLFNDGHLVDFEPAAIAKLVRALFSDSPLRNRNLEHIMKGHPSPSDIEDARSHSVPPSPRPPVSARTASRASSRGAREVSPPPSPVAPVPAPAPPKSGRLRLGGTIIVGAKPLIPSPPASPPLPLEQELSPPPRETRLPSPPPSNTSMTERGVSTMDLEEDPVIDPGLDDAIDVDDEGWGIDFGEESISPSPPALPPLPIAHESVAAARDSHSPALSQSATEEEASTVTAVEESAVATELIEGINDDADVEHDTRSTVFDEESLAPSPPASLLSALAQEPRISSSRTHATSPPAVIGSLMEQEATPETVNDELNRSELNDWIKGAADVEDDVGGTILGKDAPITLPSASGPLSGRPDSGSELCESTALPLPAPSLSTTEEEANNGTAHEEVVVAEIDDEVKFDGEGDLEGSAQSVGAQPLIAPRPTFPVLSPESGPGASPPLSLPSLTRGQPTLEHETTTVTANDQVVDPIYDNRLDNGINVEDDARYLDFGTESVNSPPSPPSPLSVAREHSPPLPEPRPASSIVSSQLTTGQEATPVAAAGIDVEAGLEGGVDDDAEEGTEAGELSAEPSFSPLSEERDVSSSSLTEPRPVSPPALRQLVSEQEAELETAAAVEEVIDHGTDDGVDQEIDIDDDAWGVDFDEEPPVSPSPASSPFFSGPEPTAPLRATRPSPPATSQSNAEPEVSVHFAEEITDAGPENGTNVEDGAGDGDLEVNPLVSPPLASDPSLMARAPSSYDTTSTSLPASSHATEEPEADVTIAADAVSQMALNNAIDDGIDVDDDAWGVEYVADPLTPSLPAFPLLFMPQKPNYPPHEIHPALSRAPSRVTTKPETSTVAATEQLVESAIDNGIGDGVDVDDDAWGVDFGMKPLTPSPPMSPPLSSALPSALTPPPALPSSPPAPRKAMIEHEDSRMVAADEEEEEEEVDPGLDGDGLDVDTDAWGF